jgi:hypothetical protein
LKGLEKASRSPLRALLRIVGSRENILEKVLLTILREKRKDLGRAL